MYCLETLPAVNSKSSSARGRTFKILCGQTALFAAFVVHESDFRAKHPYGPCSRLLIFEANACQSSLGLRIALFRIHSRLNTLANVSGLKVQGGEVG